MILPPGHGGSVFIRWTGQRNPNHQLMGRWLVYVNIPLLIYRVSSSGAGFRTHPQYVFIFSLRSNGNFGMRTLVSQLWEPLQLAQSHGTLQQEPDWTFLHNAKQNNGRRKRGDGWSRVNVTRLASQWYVRFHPASDIYIYTYTHTYIHAYMHTCIHRWRFPKIGVPPVIIHFERWFSHDRPSTLGYLPVADWSTDSQSLIASELLRWTARGQMDGERIRWVTENIDGQSIFKWSIHFQLTSRSIR